MTQLSARRVILGMRRSNFFTLALIFGLLCYLCFGAIIFSYLEHNHEQNLRAEYRDFRQSFLTKNRSRLTEQDLEELIVKITELHEAKIIVTNNATSAPLWTFGNSFLFSTTLVTTVGYGSIAALTPAGRAFSVIYAFGGIPLNLLLMGAIVERLLIPCKYIISFLDSQGFTEPLSKKVLNLFIIGVIFFICFLVIPAVVFSQMEKTWNLSDSLYYCFISLTTIGLGDLVPDGSDMTFAAREWYKISVAVYLILGICFILLLLALFYDVPQFNIGGYFLLSSDLESITEETESVTVYMSTSEKERLIDSIYSQRTRKATL